MWIDSTLVWSPAPSDSGTRVAFSHNGLTMKGSPPHQMTVDTWPMFIKSLQAYVETGVGTPI